MGVNTRNSIVTNGLVLQLDAANSKSYVSGSTTWYDLSGNGINGTSSTGTLYSINGGGSIAFNGSSGSVTNSNSVVLSSPTNSLSFNFMVYASGSTANSCTIISKGTNSGASTHLYIRRTGDLNLTWSYSNGTAAQNFAVANFFSGSTDTWVNIQITADYTSRVVITYKNGVQFSTNTMTTPVFPNITDTLYIGSFTSTTFQVWLGNIATTSIYNKVLSAGEVQQNYNALKSRFNLI
jgi:hypothetical protein